jgi:hypothetical protein
VDYSHGNLTSEAPPLHRHRSDSNPVFWQRQVGTLPTNDLHESAEVIRLSGLPDAVSISECRCR